MMRWVYSKQGTIILSVVPLLIGLAALWEFWRGGGAIFIVTGVAILALVIFEWVRLYQHRSDPNWPRQPVWVRRDKPQSLDKRS